MRRMTILAAAAAADPCRVRRAARRARPARPAPDVRTVPIHAHRRPGCDPAHLELPAGPDDVRGHQRGRRRGHRVRGPRQDGRILGEVENLTPGLSGSFSITLKPGTYTTACPGGNDARQGRARRRPVTTLTDDHRAGRSAAATQAVATYRTYVEAEAAKLVTDTTAFVDAVKAGDLAKAKQLFPDSPHALRDASSRSRRASATSTPRSTPAPTTCPPAEFEGFHRIEQQLWQKGNLDGHGAGRRRRCSAT